MPGQNPTTQTIQTDPYADYGGSVATPTASAQDPYAAYGGSRARPAPQTSAPLSESDAASGNFASKQAHDKSIAPLAGDNAWIRIKGGDGKLYDVHPEDVAEAMRRDPQAQRIDSGGLRPFVPNVRIRNLPNPAAGMGPGRALYEGAKTGLTLGSLPAAAASPAAAARALAGGALGSEVGSRIAESAGAGELGQEVGGDIGGVVGGGLTEGGYEFLKGKIPTARDIKPEWLNKRPETPKPMHGAPVTVESPLDGPTVGKQLGGKDLSSDALATLQKHVSDQIPVGSTAINRLTAAVEPITKAIADTSSKMNSLVRDAPKFTTSVMQDNVWGEGTLTREIESMKQNLPPSVRKPLSADIEAVMSDMDKALNSTDPAEVLEQRRLLGKKIDWDKLESNPTTPAEVQNLARARVYKALGDKIHADIPDTVPLDKTLQPNLELRSHTRTKLGDRVVDDPHAATAEAQSEFKKGKTAVENAAHNAQVEKNWQKIKTALIAAGVSGAAIKTLSDLSKLFE